MSELEQWRERFDSARAARPCGPGERELWGVHETDLIEALRVGPLTAREHSGGSSPEDRRLLDVYRTQVDPVARGLLWFWSAAPAFDCERFIALATNAVPWWEGNERSVVRLVLPADCGVELGYAAWLTVMMPMEDEPVPAPAVIAELLFSGRRPAAFGDTAAILHALPKALHLDDWAYDQSFPAALGYSFRRWDGVLAVDDLPAVSPVERDGGWAVEIEGVDDLEP